MLTDAVVETQARVRLYVRYFRRLYPKGTHYLDKENWEAQSRFPEDIMHRG